MSSKPSLKNLQGLVAYGYRQPRYTILLFGIGDRSSAQAFLRQWLPRVPRGDDAAAALTAPVINLAFTWSGVRTMLSGNPRFDLEQGAREFELAFTNLTPDHDEVKEQLGFVGPSAPEAWWGGGFANGDIHLAVYCASDDGEQEANALAAIRASATDAGLTERELPGFENGALSGYRPDGGILHFGYRDGITSPKIDWDGDGSHPTDFREIVLGYSSDDYPMSPKEPGPWLDLATDGSFACLAWISQDVAAFNRFLDENAHSAAGHAEPGLEREWLSAKLLGRWPDGSPLVRHPTAPPATPDDRDDRFDFAEDAKGRLCPLAAHIRVVNPRGDEMTFANQRQFPKGPPRVIRRGFSFGPTLMSPDDDGVDRGIIGTFICARINEQFYTLLRWLQKTDFTEGFFRKPYAGTMQDALFGNRSKPGADATFAIPMTADSVLRVQLTDFIAYRGVAALFLPSHRSLAVLAGLATG